MTKRSGDRDVWAAVRLLRLVSGKHTAPISGGTSNAAAYDAYLKGWELVLRYTPEDNIKAIPHLEQAVALDSNYGQAYAGLASAYINALFIPGWETPLGLLFTHTR